MTYREKYHWTLQEIFYARRKQRNIFQRFKERKCKPRIVYPAKLNFKDQETVMQNSVTVVLDSLRNLLKNMLQKTKMTTEIYTLV